MSAQRSDLDVSAPAVRAAFGADASDSMVAAASVAINSRLAAVAVELEEMADALDLKSMGERHVAYAWSVASRLDGQLPASAAASSQSGGNHHTVLPSEYFGRNSGRYFPASAVAPHEVSGVATTATRGAVPYKLPSPHVPFSALQQQQKGGDQPAEFVTQKSVAAWWASAADSSDAPKLSSSGRAALTELANSYGAALMNAAAASGVKSASRLAALAKRV